jgi:hypothetical protein
MTPAGAIAWLRTFLPCLSAACLATAALYAAGVTALPTSSLTIVVVLLVSAVPAIAETARAARANAARREQAPAAVPPGTAGQPAARMDSPVSTAPQIVEARPTVPRRFVDPRSYARAGDSEIQCPRCGGFSIESREEHECQTCQLRWPIDAAHPPLVVVRSWLHQRER